LLDLLVCPQCHTSIAEVSNGNELACTNADCGLIYPVKDGIPVMLIEEARTADAER
jgi:uncharacterized protein YbaR (Trm112 family)